MVMHLNCKLVGVKEVMHAYSCSEPYSWEKRNMHLYTVNECVHHNITFLFGIFLKS